MNITIRRMQPEDVDCVLNLDQKCFPDPWNREAFAYAAAHDFYLVAEDADKIVAYAGLQISLDEADLMNIAVDQDYRRMGIGETLLQQLILNQQKSVKKIFLEVREHNRAAFALYEKMGFASISVRKVYYHNPTVDAVIMLLQIEENNE